MAKKNQVHSATNRKAEADKSRSGRGKGESQQSSSRESDTDREHVFDAELVRFQEELERLRNEIDKRREINDIIKKSVTQALHWFVDGYNNQEFDKLNDLLTTEPEGPNATFIGTGANEYKVGRDNIIEHWRSEPRPKSGGPKLVPFGKIEMGLHGNVVCLVTLLHLEQEHSETIEMRLSGYLVRQESTWRWASIHLSTPDPTQGDNGAFPQVRVGSFPANVESVSLEDLEGSEKGDSRQLQLIITATPTELDAVLRLLGPSQSGKIQSVALESEQEVFLGTFGNFPAIVTQCGEERGWEDSSEITLYRVLNHWEPKGVAVLGRAVPNPRQKEQVGEYLIARELVRLGVRIDSEGRRDYGGARPLCQPNLDEILRRLEHDDSFDKLHVGTLVECPSHAHLPIRRLKREIFTTHSDARGLLIEGASACLAACRRGLGWLLVADLLDVEPSNIQRDCCWRSATEAASFLRQVSSGDEPWWECKAIVDQPPQGVEKFDVFMCHNSEDKDAVREIAAKLRDVYKLAPWLDETHLRPGFSFKKQLENAFETSRSAAVFIGGKGLGVWQVAEIEAFIRRSREKDEKFAVIPVMLSTCPESAQIPAFLEELHWVDFRRSDLDPYEQISYGITGKRRKVATRRRGGAGRG